MPLADAKETPHRTKQELVYRNLREAIMRCTLLPGERLVIDELARRFGVSAIPVREALQLLQSEALVVNTPHVGAIVAPVSRDAVAEVFAVMEGLETVGTRAAAQQAGEQDLERLGVIVREMDRALAGAAYEEWADLNTRFHLSICELAGMPMLQGMMVRAMDRWDRVRRYFFSGVLVHRVEQAQLEHHALLDALRLRDVELLEERVREHNQGAFASYRDYLEGSPSPSH